MSYETPIKLTHRASVLELYHTSKPKLPIVYVDDELASATAYFAAKGVPNKHLKPVNYSADACKSILKCSGVEATCVDASKKALENKCSVLWLDVQCRSVSRQVFAYSDCKYLMLTLSTRGADPEGIHRDAVGMMKKERFRVIETSRYQGKSSITNVVKIIATAQAAEKEKKTLRAIKKITPLPIQKDKAAQTKLCLSLIGKSVFIPVKQLKHGYKNVTKVKKDKYVFRVTRTYYKKRLVVQRVLPNNKLGKEREPWTLSPADVELYL